MPKNALTLLTFINSAVKALPEVQDGTDRLFLPIYKLPRHARRSMFRLLDIELCG
jgi:hypothetical protein